MRRVVGISVLVVGLLTAASAHAAKTPGVAWSPSGSFGYGTLDAADGGNSSQTFTLRNTDGKPTGTLSISLTGSSAFTKTADTCTGTKLSSKRTCSVTVKYAPTANGSDSATLAASAANTTGASVSLSGASAWQNGDLTTYGQSQWPTGTLLTDDYNNVYVGTGGLFTIGSSSGCTATTYIIQFDSGQAVASFLPQTGTAGVLTGCLDDPTNSGAGSYGGDIAALKLDVYFADTGFLSGNSGLLFGDLSVCSLTADTDLNGQSVRSLLALMNTALGGGAHVDSISDLDSVASALTASFASATPSAWAQDHLQPGSCP